MNYLDNNMTKLLQICDKGIGGGYTLTIRQIAMPLTNKCNNYCIMCHACSKSYSNHTYFNEIPYELTMDQIKRVFAEPKKTFIEKLLRKEKVYEDEVEFMFGTAESLLNKHCYEIFRYIKSIYPKSKIKLISNGTIPPQPADIVKYIDRIGFSVDGSTKDTYEYLRIPAKFDHAMQVLKEWDNAASEYNDKFSFGFSTVLSSKSVGELAGIVRLASGFRHIDSVFVQPIILHESLQSLDELLLSHVDADMLEKYISDAEEMARQTGVSLDGLDLIKSEIHKGGKSDNHSLGSVAENSKYCRYMWNGILSLNETGQLRYLCCYMEKERGEELIERYHLPLDGGIEAVYNSKELWKLRKDMLDGKLVDYCSNCSLCNAGYESLKREEAKVEEYFYV